MHELSVCRSLLGEVERIATLHAAVEIVEIVIAIGPLSGVEAQLLERAFEVARAGTIAHGARLRIESEPVVVWCRDCDVETRVAPNALLCSACGTWRVAVKSGDALLLKRIELVDQLEPAE